MPPYRGLLQLLHLSLAADTELLHLGASEASLRTGEGRELVPLPPAALAQGRARSWCRGDKIV